MARKKRNPKVERKRRGAIPVLPASPVPMTPGIVPSSAGSGDLTIERLGTTYNVNADGYIYFAPAVEANRIDVYVSDSLGNDTTGNGSEATPYKTVTKGCDIIQALKGAGFNDMPHTLRLKRDDEFEDQFVSVHGMSGRSATEPLWITAYGAGTARPWVKCPRGANESENLLFFAGGGGDTGGDHIAVTGIRFSSYDRDPTSPDYVDSDNAPNGMNVQNPFDSFLVEDCEFDHFVVMAVIPSLSVADAGAGFIWRRNVVRFFHKTDAIQGHSNGIYLAGITGSCIEEDVHDTCGWYPGVADATIFNHNFYISQNNGIIDIFRRNISARASATGAQIRPGCADCDDNLFLNNPIGFFVGQRPSILTNNVALYSQDLQSAVPSPRGSAMEIINGATSTVATNNILAQVVTNNPAHAVFLGSGAGEDVTFNLTTNTASWANPIQNGTPIYLETSGTLPTPLVTTQANPTKFYYVVNSDLSNPATFQLADTPGGSPLDLSGSQSGSHDICLTVADVQLIDTIIKDYDGGVVVSDRVVNLQQTNTQIEQGGYPDSARNIESYMTNVIGHGTPTLAKFLEETCLMSSLNYRPQYMAAAVNDYIRAGFGR